MGRFRPVLVLVILLELALIVVLFEFRATRLRYALAARQQAARRAEEENRAHRLAVAAARRTDAVERKAATFGIELQEREK